PVLRFLKPIDDAKAIPHANHLQRSDVFDRCHRELNPIHRPDHVFTNTTATLDPARRTSGLNDFPAVDLVGQKMTSLTPFKRVPMPSQLSREQLNALAQRGAAARIAELEAEIALIQKTFRGAASVRTSTGTRSGRPYNMSAAARKAVSLRMKK